MFNSLETWKLLGGLGIFLYAMFSLEESVKNLAGRSFKNFIHQQTKGKIRSILSGALVTSILQSSAAVSLMVLSFVGAGIMAMESAIGVILGSNIGTTSTAWIVALFGFKLNIELIALPLLALGGLILIFLGKSDRYSNISKLLIAFGLLFIGLAFIKEAIDPLANSFSFNDLPNYGLFFYLLIGIILTIGMQSSSGSIAITLTGLNAGLISFEYAAVMVIGANIGTTATVLIGGIRAKQIKKRVAFSHLIFNVVTAIITLILLTPLTSFVQYIIGVNGSNNVIALALFHTIFNVLGVMLFVPLIPYFSSLLLRLLPDRTTVLTHHIHNLSPSVPEAAIPGISKEINHLIKRTMKHNLGILGIPLKEIFDPKLNKTELQMQREKIDYNNLKLLQAEIFTFASEIQQRKISEDDSAELNKILHAARSALHAAKTFKDVKHNILDFEQQDNQTLLSINAGLRFRLIRLYTDFNEVMSLEDHDEIGRKLSGILVYIEHEDKEFVKNVMETAAKKEIKDLQVSETLLVNRAYIQSARLLFSSIMEMLLYENEITFFEHLTEKDLRRSI